MNYKKIILVISFLAVFSFLFGFNAPAAKAETVDELKAIIVALQQQVAQLQKQLDELLGKPKAWCHNFNRNLKYGNAGEEVRALQTALEKEGFYKTTINGDFDEYTASAVVGFQEKYAAEILAPWGLEHGTGHVGPTTRAKLNKLYGCGVVPQNPSITVLSPNGGEKWEIGKTYVISWSGNISTSKIVEIQLYRGTTYLKTITDNAPSGSANGSYSWTISNDIPIANDYKVKVSFWGGPSCPLGQVCAAVIYEYSDFSDAPFSIVSPNNLKFTVLYPPKPSSFGCNPYAGTYETQQGKVIQTYDQWKVLYDELLKGCYTKTNAPQIIDFDKQTMVAVFGGGSCTGTKVEVKTVSAINNKLAVHSVVTVAGCALPSFSFPFTLIAMDKSNLPIEFTFESANQSEPF